MPVEPVGPVEPVLLVALWLLTSEAARTLTVWPAETVGLVRLVLEAGGLVLPAGLRWG